MEAGNVHSSKRACIEVTRSAPVVLRQVEATSAADDYFLSNLDQNLLSTIKLVFTFPATGRRSSDDAVQVLRTSLEKTLVLFYPLHGRLTVAADGKLAVRLDGGGGVPFVEASADCNLEQLGDISIPDPDKLPNLVYCPPPAHNLFEVPLFAVQVTKFNCGSFALGLATNHSIVDGISSVEFHSAWSEVARGLPLSLTPFLDRSLLLASNPPAPEFPHPEYAELAPYISPPKTTLPFLHRRFVFDAAKISRLKLLAADGSHGCEQPSTFAAVTGLVWCARTKALNTPPTEPTKLLFAVDVQARLDPPLPVGFFGNGMVFACCMCPAGMLSNRPLGHAVQMVQSAVRGVTDRFVRSTIDLYELTRARPSLAGTFIITSWAGLGFRHVDFGWGPPAQIGLAELLVPEMAVLDDELDDEDRKSASLTIGLPECAMHAFEKLMDF